MIHLAAIAGLVCVMVVPRAVTGWRGLAWLAVAAALVAAVGWFGWAAGLPTAADRALVLLVALPVIAAIGMGLVIRAVVLARRWPIGPDVILTAGGAIILIVGYLRMFDVI